MSSDLKSFSIDSRDLNFTIAGVFTAAILIFALRIIQIEELVFQNNPKTSLLTIKGASLQICWQQLLISVIDIKYDTAVMSPVL